MYVCTHEYLKVITLLFLYRQSFRCSLCHIMQPKVDRISLRSKDDMNNARMM